MHILAVYAHPNPKSFNHAILDAIREAVTRKGHSFSLRDLYELNFQPVLRESDFEALGQGLTPPDVADEQAEINRADMLFLVHPVWWFGIPAIMKGWIERVFSYGFAYKYDSNGQVRGLLNGKKAVVVNTTGAPEDKGYSETGFKTSYLNLVDMGIYRFVGLEVILHRMFFSVPTVNQREREGMLESLRTDLLKIV